MDAYLETLPDWQRDVCQRIRDLVHAADPELIETIKRTKLPFFVLQGNVCALMAARDHVNVFLYDGGIVPDPDGIITAGHDNQTARTIAIREGEAINARSPRRPDQTDHREQSCRRLAHLEEDPQASADNG